MKKTLILIISFIMLIGLTSCDFLVGLDFGDSKVDFDNVKVDENFDYFADDSNVTQQDVVNLLNDMLGGKINYGSLEENEFQLFAADLGNFIFSINETGYVYDYLKNKLSLGKYVSLDAYTDDYIYSGAYFYDEGAYKEFAPLMKGTICSTDTAKAESILNGEKYNAFKNSYASSILKEKNVTFETEGDKYVLKTDKSKVVTDGKTTIEFYSSVTNKLYISYTFKVQELVTTVKENFNKFEFEKVSSYDDTTVSDFIKETKKQLEEEGKEYCKKFFEENAIQNQELSVSDSKNENSMLSLSLNDYAVRVGFSYSNELISDKTSYKYSFTTGKLELEVTDELFEVTKVNGSTIIEINATEENVIYDSVKSMNDFNLYVKIELKNDGSYVAETTLNAVIEQENGKSAFNLEYNHTENGKYDKDSYLVLEYSGNVNYKISNFFAIDGFNNKFVDNRESKTVTKKIEDVSYYLGIIADYYNLYIEQ